MDYLISRSFEISKVHVVAKLEMLSH